jgi:uncharacterized membrane protein YvbJ
VANNFCTNCGAQIGSTPFCSNCGHKQSQPTRPPQPRPTVQSTIDPKRKEELERAEQAALGCRYSIKLVWGIFLVIVGLGSLLAFPIGTVIGIVVIIVGVETMRSEP